MITDFGLSKMEQNGIMSTACGTPGYVGKPRIRNGLVLVDCLKKDCACTVRCLAEREKIHNSVMLLAGALRGPHRDWITDEFGDCKIPECLKVQRKG